MEPVKAGEWLQLLLAEPAVIDYSRPLRAPYLQLMYFCRSCKGLLNNRAHKHVKRGLWKAYQLGFEGQANSPPALSSSSHLRSLEKPVSPWFSPNTSEVCIQLDISRLQLLPKWKVNQVQEAKKERLGFFPTPPHNRASPKEVLLVLMIPTGQSLHSCDSYPQKHHRRTDTINQVKKIHIMITCRQLDRHQSLGLAVRCIALLSPLK